MFRLRQNCLQPNFSSPTIIHIVEKERASNLGRSFHDEKVVISFCDPVQIQLTKTESTWLGDFQDDDDYHDSWPPIITTYDS